MTTRQVFKLLSINGYIVKRDRKFNSFMSHPDMINAGFDAKLREITPETPASKVKLFHAWGEVNI